MAVADPALDGQKLAVDLRLGVAAAACGDGFGVVLVGLLVFAKSVPAHAPVVEGLLVGGFQLDGPGVVGDGRAVFLLAGAVVAAAVEGLGELGEERERPVEALEGLLRVFWLM